MLSYQKKFIELAIQCEALCFGSFELKSARISPYFFNAGKFNRAGYLAELGCCYAEAIKESAVTFNMLFGPAYKGIPLVSAASIALYNQQGLDLPYAFNRKESKNHGEGGIVVGSPLQGKVLIIDDVITAGTAIREVLQIIEAAGAKAAGVVIGLDRQEKGRGELSAIQEIEREAGIPVISIIKLEDIITYLESKPEQDQVEKILEYRRLYGIN